MAADPQPSTQAVHPTNGKWGEGTSPSGSGAAGSSSSGDYVRRAGDRMYGPLSTTEIEVEDQAGVGDRLVVASEIGVQKAVDKLAWSGDSDREALLRFDGTALNSAGELVGVTHPTTAGTYRVLLASSGLFALSDTGRYCWRSLDGGHTWEEHDFGSTCMSPYPRGAVVITGTVEKLLFIQGSGSAGCWITPSWPPVRQTFTSPINSVYHVTAGNNGLPLIVGQDASDVPRVARYSGGSWQEVALPTGDLGTSNSICQTPSGTYVVACWRNGTYTQWIRTSTDFTSWSARIDVVTRLVNGNAEVWLLDSGRVLRTIHDESTAAIVIKYSDTDGASWTTATHPVVAGPSNERGVAKGPDGAWYFVNSEGVVLRSEDNGATWTSFGSVGSTPVSWLRCPVTYVRGGGLTIGPEASLTVLDHAGTGQRMLTAEAADGKHTPVDDVTWDPPSDDLIVSSMPVRNAVASALSHAFMGF